MMVFTAMIPAVVDSVSAPKGKYFSCHIFVVRFFLEYMSCIFLLLLCNAGTWILYCLCDAAMY
jgi:hypothetical protein